MKKERVIDYLRELADETFQRRVWLASSGPEVSSFVEAVCGLFDDTGLGHLLERQNASPIFNAQIDDGLRRLNRMIDRVDQALAPQVLIDDPQMHVIRSEATQLITLILTH